MEKVESKEFVYEFGKFVLDPKGKTLFSDGKAIHLPAKEFETLLLLVENNHKALSKEEMMGALWRDSFVEESNLAKQISRLRKILNSDGEQFIETLPKHGYRFSADLRLTIPVAEEPPILERRPLKGSTFLYLSRETASPTEKIKSIAVLPLKPLNAGEKNKVLGLGLADALITKLGSLKQIVVRPTSAVAWVADAPADPMETGRKLGIDAVLEGAIQESEGRLRISARLIRTDSGMQLWAENFDEPANEIFALQDALSNKIAKTLAFEITHTENKLFVRRGTDNTEAYEKYLRGRFYQSQNTPSSLNRSIEFYEQALALIQFLIDHNWTEAEKSLERAIALNPNNADAYHRHAYFLMQLGRFDESLQKAEKARELNPLSNIVQNNIAMTYLYARRYPEAIKRLEKIAAENPQFSLPRRLLGLAYEAIGDKEKTFETDLKALEIEGGKELAAKLREQREAVGISAANRFWLDEAIRAKEAGRISSTGEMQGSNVPAYFVASRAAIVKDREQKLRWLERSLQEGDPTLGGIRFFARYDFVRDDPRFQAIVQKTSYQ